MNSLISETPEPIRSATERFMKVREKWAIEALSGADSLELARNLAASTDAFILELWRQAAPSDVLDATALLATGSYGRRELAAQSDIDLMIEVGRPELIDRPEFHDAVERFMTWCRDARLKLGHAVRTPEQTLREFEADLRTPISVLDARLLAGQEHLAPESVPWEPVRAPEAAEFLRADDEGIGFVQTLMEGYRARIKRNGKTIYLLEPDIKSGEGGLRDLNCIHWAGRVRWELDPGVQLLDDVGWTPEFRKIYCDGLRWILGLRNILHINHGRKHDRLNFPDQEKIAAIILEDEALPEATLDEISNAVDDDLSPSDRVTRAESLMRRHYREARAISMVAQRFLRRWQLIESEEEVEIGELFGLSNGQLGFSSRFFQAPTPPDSAAMLPSGPERALSPTEVLDALHLATEHNALLGPVLELSIAESVANWGEAERNDREFCRRFRRLLTDPKVTARTSRRLLENGILTKLVPEFEPIVCHVQHDVYHVYTTDIHSLKCLEKARKLVSGAADPEAEHWDLFRRVGAQVRRTEVFLLAALFHDIGKNRGGDHSRRGAEMMDDIGRRLGLNWGDIDRLAFLVREHLTLSDTARRRDLSDPRVIRELAARLRTVEALNELTALTFCDMATVGPHVMTDWNAALIAELYQRLRQVIENGLESLWRDHESLVEQHREALIEMLKERPPETVGGARIAARQISEGRLRSRLDAFVRDVPTDHFATAQPEALLRQFETYREAAETDSTRVSFTALPERGVTEIIICAQDVPGTLAKIAGVISASGLNIMAAQIVTTASGRTLDIFQVSQGAPLGMLLSQRETQTPADPARLDRLAETLIETLETGESVEMLLKRRIAEARLEPRPTPPVRTLVDARQDISDSFTVFEVRAPDRVGLLYEIARTLWEHGVSTHVSKIDSLGNQIIDTFYVEGLHGGKLSDAQTAELSNALYETLENSPYLDDAPSD
jgi:[protein-PII] uridylyltransferase